MTQLELQMKTGIDQSILSKYELGVREISLQNLSILADYFKTSLDYIADRTDEKAPYLRKK